MRIAVVSFWKLQTGGHSRKRNGSSGVKNVDLL